MSFQKGMKYLHSYHLGMGSIDHQSYEFSGTIDQSTINPKNKIAFGDGINPFRVCILREPLILKAFLDKHLVVKLGDGDTNCTQPWSVTKTTAFRASHVGCIHHEPPKP